jgi:hypothetical protein
MNDEYVKLLKEKQELEAKLLPPLAPVSELDHFKAKLRYFFDNVLFEKFYDLNTFIEYKRLPIEYQTKTELEYRSLEDRALQSKAELQAMFYFEGDIWDSSKQANEAAPIIANGLSNKHDGDCMGSPTICERCYAEKTYDLPKTATWNQEEGQRMVYRLEELKKQERSILLANQLENNLPTYNENINKKTKL